MTQVLLYAAVEVDGRRARQQGKCVFQSLNSCRRLVQYSISDIFVTKRVRQILQNNYILCIFEYGLMYIKIQFKYLNVYVIIK